MHCTLFAVRGTKTHSASFQGYLLDVLVRKKTDCYLHFFKKRTKTFALDKTNIMCLIICKLLLPIPPKLYRSPIASTEASHVLLLQYMSKGIYIHSVPLSRWVDKRWEKESLWEWKTNLQNNSPDSKSKFCAMHFWQRHPLPWLTHGSVFFLQ